MALDSEKDLQQLQKHLKELADRSYRQNIFTFTDFQGLAEQDAYFRMERELSFAHPVLWGGDEKCERRMIRFGNPQDLGYDEEFPIVCLHVKPLLAKFAENLSHRDFLGAIMNLGIERDCVGDIRVGEKEGYVYATQTMAEYLCEQITKIRHTNVSCTVVERAEEMPEDKPEPVEILASSCRIDGVIAKVYNMSRADSLALFSEGKVYVNGRNCTENAKILKDGDTVNVRGYGKFVFRGEKYQTKKGKLCLIAEVYR